MKIIPAIDIIDNKPVRLYQGDYGKKTIVGESVIEIAKQFEAEGASYLHVVDLDGAKKGTTINNVFNFGFSSFTIEFNIFQDIIITTL